MTPSALETASQKPFVLWPGVEALFTIQRTVVSKQTQFQSLEICDTAAFGRALFLDGKPQSAELDEHIYHEALVHPALIAYGAPHSVFIAGGGEGATLREALRHPSVERAVMVDIDGDAVEFAREHMRSWHQGAFDDARTELVIDDARAYLERTDECFDAILIDVTDPVSGGPSYLLFTQEFYRLCAERLRPDGVLAAQAESGVLLEGHASIVKTMRSVFPEVHSYQAFVPFFGEPWAFAMAGPLLEAAEVDGRLALETRFYDGETHRHIFSMPRNVRDALGADAPIITDTKPLIVA